MSQRSEDKHLLGWARSLWKTGKARKTGGVTQDAAVNSMAHPLRRCEPTPTSAARHVTVRTATRRPLSNLTSTSDDRGAANRSTWPWA
ncbi:hypothetical protein SPRG_15319, partial [Saprolegnia parasitica CBS 223.65]